jgi:hypothetical protein
MLFLLKLIIITILLFSFLILFFLASSTVSIILSNKMCIIRGEKTHHQECSKSLESFKINKNINIKTVKTDVLFHRSPNCNISCPDPVIPYPMCQPAFPFIAIDIAVRKAVAPLSGC